MVVLITGGNGFIGSHLCDVLTEKGEDVTLFDTRFTGNTSHLDVRKIQGDIRNAGDVKAAMKGADTVFHFAAVSRVAWGQERPLECMDTNTLGTARVLEAIRTEAPDATLFLGSSREVYGEPISIPVSENHQKNPISLYGISKLSAEQLVLSYRRYFGVQAVIFRFSNVYGSSRDLRERVIPKFVLRALANEPLELNEGSQVLDFTYIHDTIKGIALAYKKADKIAGEDVHFATGKGTSVSELASLVVKLCTSSSPLLVKPRKDFDVRNFVGDYAKAEKLLGWSPDTGLAAGLKKTIDAFS
ncbi:MAG: GDP-mannose 4,6-dehydratase [Candidatus Aenigmarchaeota archaeon]|nr:GDP-mannose 4,6-dehydratase [Candidatus Aenigmarchaeota archaeon]